MTKPTPADVDYKYGYRHGYEAAWSRTYEAKATEIYGADPVYCWVVPAPSDPMLDNFPKAEDYSYSPAYDRGFNDGWDRGEAKAERLASQGHDPQEG